MGRVYRTFSVATEGAQRVVAIATTDVSLVIADEPADAQSIDRRSREAA
jgi:hypothetical protein